MASGDNNFNDFPKMVTECHYQVVERLTTTLGGGAAISGRRTSDAGGGTPFRLNLITGRSVVSRLFSKDGNRTELKQNRTQPVTVRFCPTSILLSRAKPVTKLRDWRLQ